MALVHGGDRPRELAETKLTPAYWLHRVYRNSFTYRGTRRLVRGWSVKIQVNGHRRTLRLRASDREAAALEALAIYTRVLRDGWATLQPPWTSALLPHGGMAWGTSREPASTSRPVQRKYTAGLSPSLEQELFIQLSYAGLSHFIALGTNRPEEARARAAELESFLHQEGWGPVKEHYPWEFTVAVFWADNPMVCTYTTLLTIPSERELEPAPRRSTGWSVHVLEPDAGVRRALCRWIMAHGGVAAVSGSDSPDSAVLHASRIVPDLLLVNQRLHRASLRPFADSWRSRRPQMRVLEHGIYQDSDEIFVSVSGVTSGYFLRRVASNAVLEPLLRTMPAGPPRLEAEADRQICRYFQHLLEPGAVRNEGVTRTDLTPRQAQILEFLRRGFADKEIARELGISVWTVHSHLKRVFARYAVRTRTEAVVKHLQK
jgi:DNA-binding NarL/FixJ family response regulator